MPLNKGQCGSRYCERREQRVELTRAAKRERHGAECEHTPDGTADESELGFFCLLDGCPTTAAGQCTEVSEGAELCVI